MNTGNIVPPGNYNPGYPAGAYPLPYEESVWTRRGTWGSIVVGALVGFAITVILGTFGTAAGLVAGAVAADEKTDRDMGRDDRASRRDNPAMTRMERAPNADEAGPIASTKETRDAARGAAIGGAAWMVLTALAAGLIGGWVAGRIAQVYSSDVPILGLATWAVGMIVLVALAAFGAAGTLGGFGAGAGDYMNARGEIDAETGKTALTAASVAVWGFFIAQLIGLGATLLGANRGMKRRLRLYPRTATP